MVTIGGYSAPLKENRENPDATHLILPYFMLPMATILAIQWQVQHLSVERQYRSHPIVSPVQLNALPPLQTPSSYIGRFDSFKHPMVRFYYTIVSFVKPVEAFSLAYKVTSILFPPKDIDTCPSPPFISCHHWQCIVISLPLFKKFWWYMTNVAAVPQIVTAMWFCHVHVFVGVYSRD